MSLSSRLDDLEMKFFYDNDENSFVEGVLDVVYDRDFPEEVCNQNVSSDSIVFSWVEDYNPRTDEYETERLDLDSNPFDYNDVSEENKKRINDAIREVMNDYFEDMREYHYMMTHPYSYGAR